MEQPTFKDRPVGTALFSYAPNPQASADLSRPQEFLGLFWGFLGARLSLDAKRDWEYYVIADIYGSLLQNCDKPLK